MKVGSLFSGCMGFDLGLEAAGFEIAWACESDVPCRRVISRHRPDLPIYEDVRMFSEGENINDVPHVDVIAGGFPCQDLSQAGSGAGLAGERSGLWFCMRDAIRALSPRYVLIENVTGLATKMGSRPGESALGTVVADLAEAGYMGSWIRLRASDVGAPHKRERIFLLASNAECIRIDPRRWLCGRDAGEYGRSPQAPVSAGSQMARAEDALADRAASADAERERLYGRGERDAQGETEERHRWSVASGHSAPSPDSDSERREEYGGSIATRTEITSARGDSEKRDWGVYAPAIERWTEVFGREPPAPTDDRGRLNPNFTEWMMGFPDGWTEGESRTQRLRMLGNAVVVQVGETVGHILMEGTRP